MHLNVLTMFPEHPSNITLQNMHTLQMPYVRPDGSHFDPSPWVTYHTLAAGHFKKAAKFHDTHTDEYQIEKRQELLDRVPVGEWALVLDNDELLYTEPYRLLGMLYAADFAGVVQGKLLIVNPWVPHEQRKDNYNMFEEDYQQFMGNPSPPSVLTRYALRFYKKDAEHLKYVFQHDLIMNLDYKDEDNWMANHSAIASPEIGAFHYSRLHYGQTMGVDY